MKTTLAPLDGSARAEQVLPSVRMLAPLLGAKVLHAAETPLVLVHARRGDR